MKSEDIMTVPIGSLTIASWDARIEKEDPEQLQALADSIKSHGFINPITCVKSGQKYVVIAGRRRLKAAKMIGLKEVPIYVNSEISDELGRRTITAIENLLRSNLSDEEKGLGFIGIYESAGYSKQEIIKGVKAVDNYISQNHLKWETIELSKLLNSLENRDAKGGQPSPIFSDTKFMQICKSIPYTPKYQYQMMQWVTQIDPKVLKLAEAKNLSTDKKILLTTGLLKKHPEVQEDLVREFASDEYKKKDRAQKLAQQTALDLESGYLHKDNDGKYWYSAAGRSEKVKGNKIVRPLELRPTDILISLNKLFYNVTDYALARARHEYTEEIIKNSENFRLEIVKSSSDRTLMLLEKAIELNKLWTDKMLKLIDQELESRELKKGMMEK